MKEMRAKEGDWERVGDGDGWVTGEGVIRQGELACPQRAYIPPRLLVAIRNQTDAYNSISQK